MKKIMLLAFAISTGILSADADVRFGGGAHGGLSFGTFPEPIRDFYGLGYGAGVHGDVNIIEPLTIRLNVDYNRFASDKDKLKGQFSVTDPLGNPAPFEVSGLDATMFGITANVIGKIPTGSVVRPNGILGLGVHIINASDLKITSNGETLLEQSPDAGSTNFGLNLGAGTEFLIGSATLFVEAKFVHILTEQNTAHIPVTFGLAF